MLMRIFRIVRSLKSSKKVTFGPDYVLISSYDILTHLLTRQIKKCGRYFLRIS